MRDGALGDLTDLAAFPSSIRHTERSPPVAVRQLPDPWGQMVYLDPSSYRRDRCAWPQHAVVIGRAWFSG